MARSKNCLKCKYCYPIRSDSTALKDWRNNFTCDHLIKTGILADKGPDPDNCLLFEEKTDIRSKFLFGNRIGGIYGKTKEESKNSE